MLKRSVLRMDVATAAAQISTFFLSPHRWRWISCNAASIDLTWTRLLQLIDALRGVPSLRWVQRPSVCAPATPLALRAPVPSDREIIS
jgi:hypothetical protein